MSKVAAVLEPVLTMFRGRPRLTPEEYGQKLLRLGLKADGTPALDPVPLAPPIGYKKQPSMVEIVRDMVRSEKLRVAALESGSETFEEADDFDIPDDDMMPSSPYEVVFEPPVPAGAVPAPAPSPAPASSEGASAPVPTAPVASPSTPPPSST